MPKPAATALLGYVEWRFVLGMWLATRAVVAGVLLCGAPGAFAHWDGGWYVQIATSGYSYVPDGQQHAVAFFPLYPLLMRASGLPAVWAGVGISHAAFLVALATVYAWQHAREGVSVARWSVALLAWCPFSLFASVVYTEGLFLALTAVTLRAFDRGSYGVAALAGALASATRVVGAALAPGLLWAAWRERRGPRAGLAAVVTLAGLLAYMGYLGLVFKDPLAFYHAQAAWHTSRSWLDVWRRPDVDQGYAKVLLVWGGLVLLVARWRALPAASVGYGCCALALLLASGTVTSVDRYAYGVLPLALALATPLTRRPRAGLAVLAVLAVLLVSFALRFARGLWVA